MNDKDKKSTTNLLLLLILGCLVFLCLYIPYIYTDSQKNIGSIEHYDSLYSERQGHIGINQLGEVYGYTTPDGITYYFPEPIPTDSFYND